MRQKRLYFNGGCRRQLQFWLQNSTKNKEGFDLVKDVGFQMAAAKLKRLLCHGLIATLKSFFTFLVRSWFVSPVNDVYCGMKRSRKALRILENECTGMGCHWNDNRGHNCWAKIQEVPITLHKTEEFNTSPLRTIRDGWKTLCFLFYLLHQSYSSSLVL